MNQDWMQEFILNSYNITWEKLHTTFSQIFIWPEEPCTEKLQKKIKKVQSTKYKRWTVDHEYSHL